ncbi:MAG: hypothetical protein RIT51_721 [Actinomycetota bacterium]|jgi:dinuclear metal center YbgI/SA1388 family protein
MISFQKFAQVAESLWPASGAEDWDAPGLAIGRTDRTFDRVLLAVDLTREVLEEARTLGAGLIFTHHPPLLKGLSQVSDISGKGRIVIDALESGVVVFSAHTNADIVSDGVSDTLAKLLGLKNLEPLAESGAGQGHGRVGSLDAPQTLGELTSRLAALLPNTPRGVACSGNASMEVSKVALCGGAGDSFISEAQTRGADVYITSDLRHHLVQESPIPLIDVSHWASESMWLPVAARQLEDALPEAKFIVSKVSTDPWQFSIKEQ